MHEVTRKRFRTGFHIHGGYTGTSTTWCQTRSARTIEAGGKGKPISVRREHLCERCFSPRAKLEWLAEHGITIID